MLKFFMLHHNLEVVTIDVPIILSIRRLRLRATSDLSKDTHKFAVELHRSQDSLVCSAAHPVPQVQRSVTDALFSRNLGEIASGSST